MIRNATFLLSGAMLGVVGAVVATNPQIFAGNASGAAVSNVYQQLNLFSNVYERVLLPTTSTYPTNRR